MDDAKRLTLLESRLSNLQWKRKLLSHDMACVRSGEIERLRERANYLEMVKEAMDDGAQNADEAIAIMRARVDAAKELRRVGRHLEKIERKLIRMDKQES